MGTYIPSSRQTARRNPPWRENSDCLCYLSIPLGLWVGNSHPLFQPAVLWMGYNFSNSLHIVILRFKKNGKKIEYKAFQPTTATLKHWFACCLNLEAPTLHGANFRLEPLQQKREPAADPLQVCSLDAMSEQF